MTTTDFRPTHLIHTMHGPVEVMLTDDGSAYTAAEWAAMDTADYERTAAGRWTFQGQSLDGRVEKIDTRTVNEEIAEILTAYGELFHGGRPDEVAAEWVEAGITDLDAVNGWCMANVWEPHVAAALRAEGVSPQRLCDIAAKMTRGMSADERRDRWTEGCPIYAACNGDISVDDLIAAL
jgi:hypothetical protein